MDNCFVEGTPLDFTEITRAKQSSTRDGRLLERINREPAEQLGVEIGRFLGENFAGKSDVTHLLHTHRIHEKGDIRLLMAHLVHGIGDVADIADVFLIVNGFLTHPKSRFENALMQLNDVESLLAK